MLCGCFQLSRKVYMWTKITSIYLKLRPDWSLNSPANMQTETHFDTLIVLYPLSESFVFFIFLELMRSGNFGNHFDKGIHGQICCLFNLQRRSQLYVSCVLFLDCYCVIFLKLPYQQKRISDIFIGISSNSVDDLVANLGYFVHEDHNLGLKNLCSICEISYVTKSKDAHHFLTRHHHV